MRDFVLEVNFVDGTKFLFELLFNCVTGAEIDEVIYEWAQVQGDSPSMMVPEKMHGALAIG